MAFNGFFYTEVHFFLDANTWCAKCKVKKVKLALLRHRLITFIVMLSKVSDTKKPQLRGLIYSDTGNDLKD